MNLKSPKTSQRPQKPRQGDQFITSAIPNQVHNGQTSRFYSVPGQNPGRSSRGDSVVIYKVALGDDGGRVFIYILTP